MLKKRFKVRWKVNFDNAESNIQLGGTRSHALDGIQRPGNIPNALVVYTWGIYGLLQ